MNDVHGPSGVLHCVKKCKRHRRARRAPETLGEAYYAELGLIKDGMLQPTNHVDELAEVLGDIPAPTDNFRSLEVGCGVSPYASTILARGWHCTAVEPSEWACGWMRRVYGVDVLQDQLERLDFSEEKFGLILAAHSLEHMDNAPRAIAHCAELLAPGGELWVVVPNDDDLVNPDHDWFFTPETLRGCVDQAGLKVERLEMRKHVEREAFLYCRAKKSA